MKSCANLREFNVSEEMLADHHIKDYSVTLHPGDRIITLPQSMFFNTLHVTIRGETFKVSDLPDFAISCIDTYSQSMLTHINDNFKGCVVKSIKYLGRLKNSLTITVAGYAVDQVLTPLKLHLDEYIERAAKSIMTDIDTMSLGCESVNFVRASSDSKYIPLELDLTGTSPENLICGEVHHVNHLENRMIIQPMAGDFYLNNLKLLLDGKELVECVDYSIGNIKINKQLYLGCANPIYGKILVRAKVTGDVTIQYQAIGGDSTAIDVKLLEASFLEHNKRIGHLEIRTAALEQRNAQLDRLEVRIQELHDNVEKLSKQS